MMKKLDLCFVILTMIFLSFLTFINTASAANWWDKLGEPEYGGSITVRTTNFFQNLNPWDWMSLRYWTESLFENNWVDEDRSAFKTLFVPEDHWQGLLAESWEWRDPQTLIIHIHKGIHWQDKPPVNGREFTAYDVQHHFDWIMGTGSGYTEASPSYRKFVESWEKATAVDKYTLEFKFKKPTLVLNYWTIQDRMATKIEAPESVQQNLFADWRDAVGTGPWMLSNYVAGTSILLGRNPNYWGYDERHPKNRLPYADEIKILCIPDIASATAAMRTGKIDIMTKLGWQQANILQKENPHLQVSNLPWMSYAVNMRVDKEPFTDINVRKALQMAIDRKAIAKTHYGGYVKGQPAGIVAPALEGYCYAYDEWPQELKDEYSYNPEKAKSLLAQAGYPDGFKTNCVTSAVDDLELLQIIKAYFMDISVDMEIRVMDPTVAFPFLQAKKHDQMYFFTNSATHMPPSMIIFIRHSQNRMNPSVNNDAVYDGLFKDFSSVSDAEEAKKLIKKADMRVLSQHWSVNVCPTAHFNILQPYIKGYSGENADYIGDNPFYWARIWNSRQK